jgi:hypothetical protein
MKLTKPKFDKILNKFSKEVREVVNARIIEFFFLRFDVDGVFDENGTLQLNVQLKSSELNTHDKGKGVIDYDKSREDTIEIYNKELKQSLANEDYEAAEFWKSMIEASSISKCNRNTNKD